MHGLSADDLKARRAYIGASDIPVILGLSPYKTAAQLWLEKFDAGHGGVVEYETEAAEWGHRLEAVILNRYLETLNDGETLYRAHTIGRVVHPTIPWAACSPDGQVYSESQTEPSHILRGVDAKNRSVFSDQFLHFGQAGGSAVPEAVAAQMKWSMMVCEVPAWDVAVLFGGNQFRVYTIARDREWEKATLHRVEEWRNGVFPVPELPWQMASGQNYRQDESLLPLFVKLEQTEDRIATYSQAQDDIKVALRKAIGLDRGVLAGGWKATCARVRGRYNINWQEIAQHMRPLSEERYALAVKQHTVQASAYRRLSITKLKGQPSEEEAT